MIKYQLRRGDIIVNIESVKVVSFSPTGNSKKVAESIAKAIQAPIEYVDLTLPSARTQDFKEFHNELAVIATPVTLDVYQMKQLTGSARILIFSK